MGLDLNFYPPHSDNALVDMRGHYLLLDLLLKQHPPILEPYSDFVLAPDILDSTLVALQARMEHIPKSNHPSWAGFGGLDPSSSEAELMRHYWLLLRKLRRKARKHGYLICRWSS